MSRFATLAILALAAFGAEVETETKTEVKAETEIKAETEVKAEAKVKAEAEAEQWRQPLNYYAAPQATYEVIPAKAEPVHQHVQYAAPEPKSLYYSDGYIRKGRTAEGPYETMYAKCALQDPEEEAYARGAIRFTQTYGGPVKITGTVVDVTPGLHGFHIHELGDLTKGCSSTGGHLDFGEPVTLHGEGDGYGSGHNHTGDLQQAAANKQGVAYISESNDKFDLFGTHSIIGRSLVIHKRSDDAKGGAGARIACCTIGLAAPPQKKW